MINQFNEINGSFSEFYSELPKIPLSLQDSWVKLEKLISKRFDDMKEVLLIWADYTETMKELVFWLRSSEGTVKQPLHKLSAQDLNNEFFVLQVPLINVKMVPKIYI